MGFRMVCGHSLVVAVLAAAALVSGGGSTAQAAGE